MIKSLLNDTQKSVVKDICIGKDPDPGHAFQVTKLALNIFDELMNYHTLNTDDRKLLEIAAMLHDVGWETGTSKKHHKRSRDIIRNIRLEGVNSHEIELAAQVARYHRKSLPDPKRHDSFRKLSIVDQNRVEWLAAILRVADGLDRSHLSRIDRINIEEIDGVLELQLSSEENCANEIWGARRKMDLLQSKSKHRVEFKLK